jgi:probable phosphoglycerate mutase
MAALAAARTGLDIVTVPALDDMDFGRWSGTPLIELERNDQWCAWMRDRESRPSPGGESFSEVQKRIMKHLTDTFLRCPGETVAMITHAEPMRMAILEQRSLPLGAYAQITIAPASLFEIGDETRMPYFAAVA